MSAQSACYVLGEAAGQLSVTVKDRFRNGSIDVVYVPTCPSVDTLSPEAVAGMRATLDEIAGDLQAQASEQLRGREERWRFECGRDHQRRRRADRSGCESPRRPARR